MLVCLGWIGFCVDKVEFVLYWCCFVFVGYFIDEYGFF